MSLEVIKTVGSVVLDNNKVLLVSHRDGAKHINGVYGLPSGRIESGESSIEAAKRELNEETGLVSNIEDIVKLPKSYTADIEMKDGLKTFSWEVFVVRKWSGELNDSYETNPEWVNLNDLSNYDLLPNIENAIEEAQTLLNNV